LSKRAAFPLFLLGVLFLALSASAEAMTLPPGFQARTLPLPKATSPTYANGLQKPTTLDFAPDGKMFVAERNGRVLELDSIEDPTPTLVLSILDKVMAKGDRGLLGMKLDPEYPAKPYIYLSYTYDAPIGGDSADSTHTHNADGSDNCNEGNNFIDCLVSGRLARVEINPATSVAVGGAVDPSSEEVLVNSWCQQVTSHSMGDIEFDDEGALLITGGDGASWSTADYGQLGNPCQDPPNEGGSLRAQDVRTPETPTDPTNYNGAIIRVDRETGEAMPNNPFSLSPVFNLAQEEDQRARRILAYGMRNPYRFTIQPHTGQVYIGDVGQELWEEIDRVPSPPGPAQPAPNFGWPCYEGGPSGSLPKPEWVAVEKPLCQSLYANPSQVTAPFFAYPHPATPGYEDGRAFSGDACNSAPGSAIAGLAFYDPSGVTDAFPAEYDGTLFFSDAARGCIWTMEEGADGAPDPATIANFAVKQEGDPSFGPVDVVEGPDGSLFVPNFYGDSIVQIRFQGPSAKVSADKTYGPMEPEDSFTVQFDASGSRNSSGGTSGLHYEWDLDGDGQFDDGTDSAQVEHTYTSLTNVTARVRVSDGTPHVDVAAIKLYPGDVGPPTVEIKKPTPGVTWGLGEEIHYEATATDPDGEGLGSGLTPHWEFSIQHCPSGCHLHPLTSSDSASGTVTAESDGFPSKFRLEFTATDSRGLSTSQVVELLPRSIEIHIHSQPPGVPLTLNGATSSEPLSVSMIAGESATVAAPPSAVIGGQEYPFAGWSDGGDRIHEVISQQTETVVAEYKLPGESESPPREPAPEPPPAGGGNDSPAGGGNGSPAPAGGQASKPASFGHLRLASRPSGAALRVGAIKGRAPFSLQLLLGRRTFLLAPRMVERHGRILYFKHWLAPGGTVRTARRLAIVVPDSARFIAVFGAR
jgi:glucose/arabinose dehydrogenase